MSIYRGAFWADFAGVCIFLMSAGMANSPCMAAPPTSSPHDSENILNLDLEQLAKTPVVVPSMDVPVSSVMKQESTVGRSAAAVFVITPEMIRRSGATCIPEVLRMAPGLEVAQINANSWAITSRGSNYPYPNKLLVLIDGRTAYNPDFSGVLWNAQDVLLEDVERIEVIRGPGGTLWGANAMNGVINIITKKAKDTQGAYVMAGGGTQLKMTDAFRYGGRIGDNIHYRVYGKHFEQGANFDPAGQADDAWRKGQFGFRTEWEPDRDKKNIFTIQGDHYVGSTNNSVIPTFPALSDTLTGENLLARWTHIVDDDSNWYLQTYYDNYMRSDAMQTQVDKTIDIEFQYRFPWGDRHKITCGAGFRNVNSYFPGGDTFTQWFSTPYYTTTISNQFIQDEMTIVEDRLAFILGCKLEQYTFTGLEYEPTARVLWTPDHRHSAWCAVSRAVHTPSRLERDISVTAPAILPGVYPRLEGTPGLASTAMLAYEIGYRQQATDKFSWDIATFYNAYDHARTGALGTPFPEPLPVPQYFVVPVTAGTDAVGEAYGVELATNYSVSEHWRLYAQYTMLQLHMRTSLPSALTEEGYDPHNQVYLRSTWDLSENVDFDLMARYVDSLALLDVPSYITMDVRLAWRPRKHLEVAAVGQNLLQARHREFAGNSIYSPVYATEVPRGVYGTVAWRF